MSLFIGIDGGGTKTKCVLVNHNLKILAKTEGGSSNPLTVGTQKSSELIAKLIKSVINRGKVNRVDGIVIGAAGAGRKKNADELKKSVSVLLNRENISSLFIKVVSDAEITVEGAFAGGNGAILIAGTGSIIWGKDKNGKIVRAGGFGRILGDEGGGYSIGKKAFNAAAKLFDSNNNNSILISLLKKNFGIVDLESLILKVYSEDFDIASAAGLIIKTAGSGDKFCRNILNEESSSLVYYVDKFKRKFGSTTFKLCFSGGLLAADNYYSKILKSKIKKSFKGIELIKPKYPPETGAAILAKKSFNAKHKEFEYDN